MQNFVETPTLLKSHELFDVVQAGGSIQIVSKSARVAGNVYATLFVVAEIKANSAHYMRAIVPDMEARGFVAFVVTKVDGKTTQIGLTAEQYATGADERSRYDRWQQEVAAITAAGRAFWDGVNEGGEGFNPYR